MDHGVGIEVGFSSNSFLAEGSIVGASPADQYYIEPCPTLVEVVALPRTLRTSRTGIFKQRGSKIRTNEHLG